jgi:predicted phosphoribosyltransferase
MPKPFCAVGVWYQDFSETTDDEVRQLLDRAIVPENTPAVRGARRSSSVERA